MSYETTSDKIGQRHQEKKEELSERINELLPVAYNVCETLVRAAEQNPECTTDASIGEYGRMQCRIYRYQRMQQDTDAFIIYIQRSPGVNVSHLIIWPDKPPQFIKQKGKYGQDWSPQISYSDDVLNILENIVK